MSTKSSLSLHCCCYIVAVDIPKNLNMITHNNAIQYNKAQFNQYEAAKMSNKKYFFFFEFFSV